MRTKTEQPTKSRLRTPEQLVYDATPTHPPSVEHPTTMPQRCPRPPRAPSTAIRTSKSNKVTGTLHSVLTTQAQFKCARGLRCRRHDGCSKCTQNNHTRTHSHTRTHTHTHTHTPQHTHTNTQTHNEHTDRITGRPLTRVQRVDGVYWHQTNTVHVFTPYAEPIASRFGIDQRIDSVADDYIGLSL